jgi:hypothetical protein
MGRIECQSLPSAELKATAYRWELIEATIHSEDEDHVAQTFQRANGGVFCRSGFAVERKGFGSGGAHRVGGVGEPG